MAGSIAYISFPQFTRKRNPPFPPTSEMCLRTMEAFVTFRGITTHLPRPAWLWKSTHENGFPKDCYRSWPGQANRPRAEEQTVEDYLANGPVLMCPCETCSATRVASNMDTHPKAQQGSSRSSSPAASLRSVSSKLRAGLTRRWSSWRSERVDSESLAASEADTTATVSRQTDSELIAEIDALSLSQHELGLVRRMEQVCKSARAARNRRFRAHDEAMDDWNQQCSARSEDSSDSDSDFEPGVRLRLRGGGGDDDDLPPRGATRRRTTLPYTPDPPKPDSARPNAAVWWLAGGRRSREGQVPTVGELRVRKEVEQANRKIVGFWGTVLGMRRVGKVGILQEGGSGGIGEGGSLEEAEADAAGPRNGDEPGGAGSVAGSHGGERGVEPDDVESPVEAKAESLMGTDDEPGDAKVDSSRDAAEDHGAARAESRADAANDRPERRAESVKGDVEDTDKAGAEETTDAARAESVGDGEAAAEIPREHKAKSPSED